MRKHSMDIFIRKEDEETGYIGIFMQGVVVLDNIGSIARACALMLGVIYTLNLAYPKELRHYYEFIQKVHFKLEAKIVLGLKNKIGAGQYNFFKLLLWTPGFCCSVHSLFSSEPRAMALRKMLNLLNLNKHWIICFKGFNCLLFPGYNVNCLFAVI